MIVESRWTSPNQYPSSGTTSIIGKEQVQKEAKAAKEIMIRSTMLTMYLLETRTKEWAQGKEKGHQQQCRQILKEKAGENAATRKHREEITPGIEGSSKPKEMTGENTIIIIIIRKNGEEITLGIEEGKLERSSKARKLTAVRKDQGIENMTTERVYHLGGKKRRSRSRSRDRRHSSRSDTKREREEKKSSRKKDEQGSRRRRDEDHHHKRYKAEERRQEEHHGKHDRRRR
mmetsp:Transcript_14493/g.25693  ORF Transcript_14493/g.25693 Transcript_14493/m.25693 type:complete len:231 (-) Transcript_14493:226-918(-)